MSNWKQTVCCTPGLSCLLAPWHIIRTVDDSLLCAAQAILNIISNPVNSTVPIAAEVLKAAGVYKPSKYAQLACMCHAGSLRRLTASV